MLLEPASDAVLGKLLWAMVDGRMFLPREFTSIAVLLFRAGGLVRYPARVLPLRFAGPSSSDAFAYWSEAAFFHPPVRDPSREWQDGGRRVPASAQGDRYAYP
jgi:hypothetical protein